MIETCHEGNIRVLFFGGEPLLNFNVLEHFILYCNNKIFQKDKKITYTIVTNGTLFTESMMEFFDKYNVMIQTSIDGNKENHNFLRPFAGNKGSFDIINRKIKKIISANPERNYVRATVNHYNLDLVNITESLLNMGFKNIHLELITAPENSKFRLTDADFKRLLTEYKRLAEYYLDELKKGNVFRLEGFSNVMSSTCYNEKKYYGCGVGRNFIAITPHGDIYPCHRFQGMKEWKMGDIYNGIDEKLRKMFISLFVDNIEKCKNCWARYYCGGGCIVESMTYNNSIYKPPEDLCNIRRVEIELALKIYSILLEENETFFHHLTIT
jgi:uncharacterized protein